MRLAQVKFRGWALIYLQIVLMCNMFQDGASGEKHPEDQIHDRPVQLFWFLVLQPFNFGTLFISMSD